MLATRITAKIQEDLGCSMLSSAEAHYQLVAAISALNGLQNKKKTKSRI